MTGPNGIGKTTLLNMLATGHAKGEHIPPGIRISYYRQDFSTLDFEKTVYQTLLGVIGKKRKKSSAPAPPVSSWTERF